MPDEKVYHQEVIEDQPFPDQREFIDQPGVSEPKDIHTPSTIKGRKMPKRIIVNEVINEAFDTQSRRILGEFAFEESGALQFGRFVEGKNGDVRISQTGILGRDINGDTTFSIDATTGDATFKGTVAAGSIVTGYIAVGGSLDDIGAGGVTATYIGPEAVTTPKIKAGAVTAAKITVTTLEAVSDSMGEVNVGDAKVKIDGPNKRIIINDGTNDRILLGFQASGF